MLFALLGWFVSKRHPEPVRKVARGVAIVPATILLVLMASSWLLPNLTAAGVHRWSGHVLVIVMWLAVPFVTGVGLHRQHGLKVGVAAILLLPLFVSLLASFTGYLDLANAGEATKHRFVVLHIYVLPITVAALLAAWCFIFRPIQVVSD
jgi:hypothetical protein